MLDSLRRHARALASLAPVQILDLSGTLRGTDDQVTALYAGNGSNLDFIATSLFASTPRQRLVQTASALMFTQVLSRLGRSADIVVTERPPLWALLGGAIGAIRIPAWVRQELHLSGAAAEQWTLGRHLEREVERQIRRHDYRLAMSDSPADTRAFFQDFYLPYIRARHGSGAITASEQDFTRVASRATLAKLFCGNVWIAGMLLRRHADTLRLGWFGVNQNRPLPGASEVLDVLCIRRAVEQGVRRIDFGNSRPSLIDGVVRYKRKFGARLRLPRYPQVMIELQINSDRAVLRDWLTRQQFLCKQSNTLLVAGYSSTHPSSRVEFNPQ